LNIIERMEVLVKLLQQMMAALLLLIILKQNQIYDKLFENSS